MKAQPRVIRPKLRALTLLLASLAAILLPSGCASLAELSTGVNYDHRAGWVGGQVTIKLAPSAGYQKNSDPRAVFPPAMHAPIGK